VGFSIAETFTGDIRPDKRDQYNIVQIVYGVHFKRLQGYRKVISLGEVLHPNKDIRAWTYHHPPKQIEGVGRRFCTEPYYNYLSRFGRYYKHKIFDRPGRNYSFAISHVVHIPIKHDYKEAQYLRSIYNIIPRFYNNIPVILPEPTAEDYLELKSAHRIHRLYNNIKPAVSYKQFKYLSPVSVPFTLEQLTTSPVYPVNICGADPFVHRVSSYLKVKRWLSVKEKEREKLNAILRVRYIVPCLPRLKKEV
jgi:hypothetical protein